MRSLEVTLFLAALAVGCSSDSRRSTSSDAAAPRSREVTRLRVCAREVFTTYSLGLVADELLAREGVRLEVEVPAKKHSAASIQKTYFGDRSLIVVPGPTPGQELLRVSNYEQLYRRLVGEFSQRRSPWDIVEVNADDIPELAPHLEPLQPWIDRLGLDLDLDDIAPVFRDEHMVFDGTLYAVVEDGDIHLLMYNKDAFERPENRRRFRERTGRELAPPRTWREYDELVRFFHGWGWDGSDRRLYGAAASYSDIMAQYWWRHRFFAYGGQYFDEDLHPLINSAPGVRALSEMIDTLRYYHPEVLTWEQELAKVPFFEGEAAMLVSFPSTARTAQEPQISRVRGRVGFALIPGHAAHGGIVRAVPSTGGRYLAIPRYARHKEAAARAIAFVSTRANSLAMVVDPRTIMDPWRLSHLDSERFRTAFPGAAELLEVNRESLRYVVRSPVLPGCTPYKVALSGAIARALRGEQSPRQALDQAASEWDAITGRYDRSNQLRLWNRQLETMRRAGFRFRPELAEVQ